MNRPDRKFAAGFLSVACGRFLSREDHGRRLEQLIDRELTRGNRWTNVFVAVYGLAGAGVLLALFAHARDLPWYPAIPPVIYLIFAATVLGGAARHLLVALRGRYSEWDRTAKAQWVMWCTVASVSVLLMWWLVYPGIDGRTYYGLLAVSALVLAVAEALHQQVKSAHLDIRERLLAIELRLAELSERTGAEDSELDSPGQ